MTELKKEAIGIMKIALAIFAFAVLPLSSYAQIYYPSTVIYGKVLDKRGNPVEGELITAQWSDDFGNHSVHTKTLTKNEAKAIGDGDLWGSYVFSNSIKARPGTKIIVQTQPKAIFEVIISDPGETIMAEPMTIPGLEVEIPEDEPEQEAENAGPISDSYGNFLAFLKTISRLAAILAPVFGLGYMTLVISRKSRAAKKLARGRLSEKAYGLGRKKIKGLMKKNVITITKDAGVLEVLEMMITKGVNSVVIVSKHSPVGIISECDFLKKVYTRDKIEPLKANDIMSTPLKTIDTDATLFECIEFALKNNIRRIPVVNGDSLQGIITVTDLLNLFHDFFTENPLEGNLPVVQGIMSKGAPEISDDARLSDVLSFMIWKKTSYMVPKDGRPGRIITSSDALAQYYKNMNEMYKMKLKQITTQEIIFVSPYATILAALEMMRKNDYRRLPVVSGDKVVGIITPLMMLSELYAVVKQMKAR